MIITRTVTKTITESITDDVICNKCGNSCKTNGGMTMDGLLEAYVCGGYGARLGDEVEYKFSLCENCLAEFFKTFKHSPLLSDAEDECMKKEINV